MKRHTLTNVIAALSGIALSMGAAANDGVYISGFLLNTSQDHTLERNTGTNETPSITTRSEETDIGAGLALGYKTHVNDTVFVAVEGFYNKESVESRNLNNLLITEVELNATYGINLKAGFDITDAFSLYGFVGSTWVDIDLSNSYPFAPPMREGSTTESEFTLGFGASYKLSENLSVVGEYTQLNDLSFDPLPEVAVPGKVNPNELDLSSWKVGLSYNF
jgi:opacity protein-like surface antigen